MAIDGELCSRRGPVVAGTMKFWLWGYLVSCVVPQAAKGVGSPVVPAVAIDGAGHLPERLAAG